MVTHGTCPFRCGWDTDDVMSEPEFAAVEGGANRLLLHLRVEHSASVERDRGMWDDGWQLVLFPNPNPVSL